MSTVFSPCNMPAINSASSRILVGDAIEDIEYLFNNRILRLNFRLAILFAELFVCGDPSHDSSSGWHSIHSANSPQRLAASNQTANACSKFFIEDCWAPASHQAPALAAALRLLRPAEKAKPVAPATQMKKPGPNCPPFSCTEVTACTKQKAASRYQIQLALRTVE